jgi:hypothetical protein
MAGQRDVSAHRPAAFSGARWNGAVGWAFGGLDSLGGAARPALPAPADAIPPRVGLSILTLYRHIPAYVAGRDSSVCSGQQHPKGSEVWIIARPAYGPADPNGVPSGIQK